MEKLDKSFVDKFRLEELLIKRVGSWKISLRPQQPTIGSLVLTLNRKCTNMGQLLEHEAKDLGAAFKAIEELLAKTFRPAKINYLALMMVDNQVHFHVIPRYSETIKIDTGEYRDKNWPGPPSLEGLDITPGQLDIILNSFKGIS